MRRRLWHLAAAALVAGLAAAAPGDVSEGDPVAVEMTGGRTLHGTLIRQDERTVTISYLGATVELARSSIRRIGPSDASPPRLTPDTRPAIPGRLLEPRGPTPWAVGDVEIVEKLLDEYFAASDDPARKAVADKLAASPLCWRHADLERMRAAAGEERWQKHVPVPWRKGADRAWYNLALPKDYTPAKAWPLVIALHGMPGNGDNLAGWYNRYFPGRGYIVLYPTTVHKASFWPAPEEKRELLKLLRHVCRTYRVDYRRIYCTGASGGGIGTWHWLTTLPDLFAGGISFSAAGTIFDQRLARLADVPFYVHHGTADYIPIASVERAVAEARGHGAEQIVFHVSEGTGHTPPQKDFDRAFEWLTRLPPKEVSPIHLLESADGALPMGYRARLPFAGAWDGPPPAVPPAVVARWSVPERIDTTDLLAAMVAVGRIVDPTCEAVKVRAEVRRLAAEASKRAAGQTDPQDVLAALNEVFFQTEGFRQAPSSRDSRQPPAEAGSSQEPTGMSIAGVLKRKTGPPQTLTGLYVLVAVEMKLPARGVVAPVHAWARLGDGDEAVNVEMTETGGHFGDAIYRTGYGLRAIPPPGKSDAAPLIGAMLGELAKTAWQAGAEEKARALAGLAIYADPRNYNALMVKAFDARKRGGKDAPTEAAGLIATVTRLWADYAEPRAVEGELLLAGDKKMAAVAAWRAGIAAPIKPYGADAPFSAELYFRIAEVYAELLRSARARNRPTMGYMVPFHKAIVGCLNNNPDHDRARQLFLDMGGKIRERQ